MKKSFFIKSIICFVVSIGIIVSGTFVSFATFSDGTTSDSKGNFFIKSDDNTEIINVVDIVIIIDSTKNAEPFFETLKEKIKNQISVIDTDTNDYRISIVQLRDFTQRTSINDFSYDVKDFMSDPDEIFAYLDSITLSEYSNPNTCLFYTLMDGVSTLSFRENAGKAVILFGLSACYDPEPYTGYCITDVIQKFGLVTSGDTSKCPVKFFAYNLGANKTCEQYYKYFSDFSGGAYFSLNPSSESFADDIGNCVNDVFNHILNNVKPVKQNTFVEIMNEILESCPDLLKPIVGPIIRIVLLLYKMIKR